MSEASRVATDDDTPTTDGQLTANERGLFERLADRYEGEEVGQICETVLQSSASESEDNEEARS